MSPLPHDCIVWQIMVSLVESEDVPEITDANDYPPLG